jgi:hypothetical protein
MSEPAVHVVELPPLFKDLVLLDASTHADWTYQPLNGVPWLSGENLVPLTFEEFEQAQRDYPVVFSLGDRPVPLALMGLTEGTNAFVDADGGLEGDVYLPAYARAYPCLIRSIDGHDLLGFDPTWPIIAPAGTGQPLVADGAFTPVAGEIYRQCELFAASFGRTQALVMELLKHDLLIDGEATVSRRGDDKAHTFNGFRIIDQARFQALGADVLADWNARGILVPVAAHLMSLQRFGALLDRHLRKGDPGFVDARLPEPSFGKRARQKDRPAVPA